MRRARLTMIVALRNEKGSYNTYGIAITPGMIVALRNEKGSYNFSWLCFLR